MYRTSLMTIYMLIAFFVNMSSRITSSAIEVMGAWLNGLMVDALTSLIMRLLPFQRSWPCRKERMRMKFPTIKEMAEEVAKKALDEFEYKGKTLRQWIDAIYAASESFEWCEGCKEYDQEQHCCHRYSKVIRQTVAEMKLVHCIDCQHSEYDEVYKDRYCHYNGKAEVVDD